MSPTDLEETPLGACATSIGNSMAHTYTQVELELMAIWTDILEGSEHPWALFQFGTCVILQNPGPHEDLKQQAIDMMGKWAIPIPGNPSFKYSISFLTNQGIPGCIISCHHPDIMTYVAPAEAPVCGSGLYEGIRMQVGDFGRKKRQWDCETLKIIHLEDKRPKPTSS